MGDSDILSIDDSIGMSSSPDEPSSNGSISPKGRKRMHECDKCRGLDKLPESCIGQSNREAQNRSRHRKALANGKYEGLLSEYSATRKQNEQLTGIASYVIRVLSTMTHFCGWSAEDARDGMPDSLEEIFCDLKDPYLNGGYQGVGRRDMLDGVNDGQTCYKGEKAPCEDCKGKKHMKEWCYRCTRLKNNKATDECRKKKKNNAAQKESLESQVRLTQSMLNAQRRLCQCLINVIRDAAWCPACNRRAANGTTNGHSSLPLGPSLQCGFGDCDTRDDMYPEQYFANYARRMDQMVLSASLAKYNWSNKPTSMLAANRDFSSGPERQDSVTVNSKRLTIEPWFLQPPDSWATHSMLAAMNFYKNLDSLQWQIARAHGVKELQPATKALFDNVMNDCLIAMNALLDENYYEPLALIKQVGQQTELVAKSFFIVISLHRIHMTAKMFPPNDGTRLMITHGLWARLDGIDDYLMGFTLPAEAHAALSRLLKAQWDSERCLATQMAGVQVGEDDVAFLIFFAVLEQAKRILYRHEEHQLSQIIKDYRDTLAATWSTNNPNRLYRFYGLLTDVADFVHDFSAEYANLRATHPNRPWNDVWNHEYIRRSLALADTDEYQRTNTIRTNCIKSNESVYST